MHLLDATMFWTPGGGGGVHRVLCTKRDWLVARGWRHTLLAPGVVGPAEVDCGGVRIPGSGGYRFVIGRAHAARQIEAAAPDVVEAADPYALGWAALEAAARLQVPAVAFCHSNLPEVVRALLGGRRGGSVLGRWSHARARDYLARLYGRYDLVLAPSRTMTVQLQAWGVRRAMHQPLGVDCAVFSPQARDDAWRAALVLRLGLPAATRLFVYVGRFAPEKNLGVLADAVRRLGPGHALLAVGAGPRPPTGGQVHVLAPLADSGALARLVASCDAFVHAGDQETFGLAALEAMACGTPVVLRAAGGLAELGAGVAVLVDGDATDVWADALRSALQPSAAALARAALARAREHAWNAVLEVLAGRYVQAVRSSRRGTAASQRAPADGAATPTAVRS